MKMSAKQFIDNRHKKHQYVMDALEEAIQKGPWEKSAFLKATRERLNQLKVFFDENLKLSHGYMMSHATFKHIKGDINRAGQLKVYVSLYNTEGSNMEKWSKIIQDLAGKVVTRAVYRIEEDIRSYMKIRPNQMNEAYIILYINPTELVNNGEETMHDKDGREIVLLRDGAIQMENVDKFIHMGQSYALKYNRLVPINAASEQ